LRATGFRKTGAGFAVILLRAGAFLLIFFLLAFFLDEGFFPATGFVFDAFFLLAFFLAAGFFFDAFFLATDLFFDAFFLLAFFLAAGFFFDAFFLATDFFLATFFLDDFLATGFFRVTAFFFDAFFVDAFFLLTLDFLPTDFFLLTELRLAALFREAFAGLRFLLALFFAGISYSCRSEKNAQLYIDGADMEALKSRFSSTVNLARHACRAIAIFGWRLGPEARKDGRFGDSVFS
jgi:hypothetical protein